MTSTEPCNTVVEDDDPMFFTRVLGAMGFESGPPVHRIEPTFSVDDLRLSLFEDRCPRYIPLEIHRGVLDLIIFKVEAVRRGRMFVRHRDHPYWLFEGWRRGHDPLPSTGEPPRVRGFLRTDGYTGDPVALDVQQLPEIPQPDGVIGYCQLCAGK